MIPQLTRQAFGLYVILTEPEAGYAECARAAVRAGVRFIQLRMKNSDTAGRIAVARVIRDITRNTQSLFIVNDDLEAAIAVDADGVHLGQSDLPLAEARAIWRVPGKIFGLSTHNELQAQQAAELRPDYIGVGPVFPTPTKVIPDPVLGVERAGAIIRTVGIPAVAIGGINEENLSSVLEQGAVNFSAVRPVMQAGDPYAVIMKLQELWAVSRAGQ